MVHATHTERKRERQRVRHIVVRTHPSSSSVARTVSISASNQIPTTDHSFPRPLVSFDSTLVSSSRLSKSNRSTYLHGESQRPSSRQRVFVRSHRARPLTNERTRTNDERVTHYRSRAVSVSRSLAERTKADGWMDIPGCFFPESSLA